MPAFVAVAMKVTDVPAQILLLVAVILADGVPLAFTVIKIELDETTNGLAQLAFDVKVKLMISLLFNALSVYVIAFTPTFRPFFFH